MQPSARTSLVGEWWDARAGATLLGPTAVIGAWMRSGCASDPQSSERAPPHFVLQQHLQSVMYTTHYIPQLTPFAHRYLGVETNLLLYHHLPNDIHIGSQPEEADASGILRKSHLMLKLHPLTAQLQFPQKEALVPMVAS